MSKRATEAGIAAIYVLFFASGFAALIYESVWSYYLKLFLGHSAYGQMATLAIFMGGIGAGSFLAGKRVPRIRNPLLAYAIAEALIGMGGLTFHRYYDAVTTVCLEHLMGGGAGSGAFGTAVQIAASIAIAGPWAVLLGATFPFLASALMRWTFDGGSRSLPGLYFANALGGAIGIAVCSYFLLRALGTPGALRVAGFANLGIALCSLFLAFAFERAQAAGKAVPAELARTDLPGGAGKSDAGGARAIQLLLFCAFFTSVASFLYEIGWIRLISLIFGSSTHSFDVAVSAFIFGLAFGGLFARRFTRGGWDRVVPVLAGVQIAMGGFAMATIFLYKPLLFLVAWTHEIFGPTDAAYPWYSGFKYLAVLGMMFPAAFCAGMTLPLITYALVGRTGSEKYTGYVYGFNTFGAIAGAVAGGLVVLPLLQLKNTIALGASMDVVLGVILALCGRISWPKRGLAFAAAAAIIWSGFQYSFEGGLISQGVFRRGSALIPAPDWSTEIRDGRTATISLHRGEKGISIRTNGKSDGAVRRPEFRGDGGGDSLTMAAVAFLPMARQHAPYRAALIGLGTGMTAHHLLSDPLLEELDIIEIEPEVVRLCRNFEPYNARVYRDERVRFVVDDAKRFFYRAGKKYDVIISEPSNPWVSGVASLFSREFYHHASRFLKDGGILVQWVQLYEFNDRLLLSIIGALSLEFDDGLFYGLKDSLDVVLLASKGPMPRSDLDRLAALPDVRRDFEAFGWSQVTFSDRFQLASGPVLDRLWRVSAVPANSDFYPFVDQNAEKPLFKKEQVRVPAMFDPGQFAHYRRLYESEESYAAWRENFRIEEPPARGEFPGADSLFALLEAGETADPEPDWEKRERVFYEAVTPFFHSGMWNELEPVTLFREQLAAAGDRVPANTRMRFRLVDGWQREDGDTIRPALEHFLENEDKFMLQPEWVRLLVVAGSAHLSPEDALLLKVKHVDGNRGISEVEKAFIDDVMLASQKRRATERLREE